MNELRPTFSRWIVPWLLAAASAPAAFAGAPDRPWSDELDAVVAASESHRVLLENDRVRVLEVVIQPGEREPAHTHRWPSVMTVLEPARIRYYGPGGELRFETPEGRDPNPPLGAEWMGPEGLHAVENIDRHPFRALRVELKGHSDGGDLTMVAPPRVER